MSPYNYNRTVQTFEKVGIPIAVVLALIVVASKIAKKPPPPPEGG